MRISARAEDLAQLVPAYLLATKAQRLSGSSYARPRKDVQMATDTEVQRPTDIRYR